MSAAAGYKGGLEKLPDVGGYEVQGRLGKLSEVNPTNESNAA